MINKISSLKSADEGLDFFFRQDDSQRIDLLQFLIEAILSDSARGLNPDVVGGLLRAGWIHGNYGGLLRYAARRYQFESEDYVIHHVITSFSKQFHSSRETWHLSRCRGKLIEAYRGSRTEDQARTGMSWSLSKEVAEWFASRHDGGGWVVKALVYPSAWLDDGDDGECEIVAPDGARIVLSVEKTQ